jgi:tRNA/rRNA methyltransferase
MEPKRARSRLQLNPFSILDNLRVVLVRSRNPLNIGAAARAMSNFGAMHLRLVTPFELAYREAVSAVGAEPLLTAAEEHSSVQSAVQDCGLVIGTTAIGHRELQHEVHSLDAAAKIIRKKIRTGRVAILFGSEKTGLSNQDLSHCHWLLRIPTREQHRSMNLAQAVAIVVYELSRSESDTRTQQSIRNNVKKISSAAADMASINRLHSALLEALQLSGYSNRPGTQSADEKLRRMLRRFELNSADAEVLLGMLRKILWKLHANQKSRE